MGLLVLAIVLAVVMLVGVNWIIQRTGRPTFGAVAVCLILSGAPAIWFVSCLPLLAQGYFLALTLPLAYIARRGPMIYRSTSVVVALAVWITTGVLAVRQEGRYERWRERNPFESMLDRVPEPKLADRDGTLSPLFERLEAELSTPQYQTPREQSLRTLYDQRVLLFLHSAGFGVERLGLDTLPRGQHFAPELVPIIPQADEYNANTPPLSTPSAEKLTMFEKMHGNNILDFVNPNGFGLAKSPTEVAGFRPHHFNRFPELMDRWSITRVELIGLLKHDPPEVYVSEILPRMDQLASAPTRKLDAFEAGALTAIRKGEDLFVRGDDKDVRMVGAIRNVEQCVKCHGGKRGDLLGAFSYRVWWLGDVK